VEKIYLGEAWKCLKPMPTILFFYRNMVNRLYEAAIQEDYDEVKFVVKLMKNMKKAMESYTDKKIWDFYKPYIEGLIESIEDRIRECLPHDWHKFRSYMKDYAERDAFDEYYLEGVLDAYCKCRATMPGQKVIKD